MRKIEVEQHIFHYNRKYVVIPFTYRSLNNCWEENIVQQNIKIPLFEALHHHRKRKHTSYHVPGHKNGFLLKNIFRQIGEDWQNFLQYDQTELRGLDDLHAPEGVIKESQNLLAKLYKTKESFFIINGSTVGNLAMILSSFQEGDSVLVQRNSHQSIMHALELANVKPIFISPYMDKERETPSGIDPDTVRQALDKYSHIKGIVLTYPNYYGVTYPLREIIELAHERNIPVLVDEAHGAHFIIGEPFPPSATELGADIVVQSAHKTLPAMTMGSFLHFNSELLSVKSLRKFLQMLQSSSPSYPIMMSLDIARAYVESYNEADCNYLRNEINSFIAELTNIHEIKVIKNRKEDDLLKITIQSQHGLSGYCLQKAFEEEGIFTELADPKNVLFIFPLLKNKQKYPWQETIKKMDRGLKTIDEQLYISSPITYDQQFSTIQYSYKAMKTMDEIYIPIAEACDHIAANSLKSYFRQYIKI